MQASIQKLPKSQIELTIEIPSADFDNYLDRAVENLAKNLEIKGFRKGYVPKEMAKTYLSQKDILEEAANLAVNDTYPKAIDESKIEVIDSPKIEILKIAPSNPLIYKATVSVLPDIKLPDYKKIAQNINSKNKKDFDKKIKVEEKEVDDAISWLQKSRAKYITVNREAGAGDYIKIKLNISARGGSAFGGKNQISKINEGQLFHDREKVDPFNQGAKVEEEMHEGVIGKGYFLPDFEKNLIGMKAGEKKNFSQRIPLSHINKELAGETLDFEVSLDLVQEVEMPKADDEFAKLVAPLDSKHPTGQGNFENLNSLRQSIQDGIKTQKEEKEKQKNRQEIIQEIADQSQAEIPDVLVGRRVDDEISRIKEGIENSSSNFSQYLGHLKKTEDELKKDLRLSAQNQVKIALILRQIGKNEQIGASQEEINEKVNQYLKRFSKIDEARQIDSEHLKLYYEDAIRNEKTFQLLESCTNK